ncbi:MAG TPA: hypothetical protein VFB80_15070 [Pirellulaceae bacterium]|nr:hypothetical protein [Pirellulaceae bacterium]
MRRTLVSLIAALVLVAIADMAAADTVQLANGDTLSGEVLSLDAKALKIKSPILGEVTIGRAKVQSITLGDAAARPAAKSTGDGLSVEGLLKQLGGVAAEAAGKVNEGDLLKQLQGGIDPAELDKLKKQMPLLASPEVQAYFNKTVGGLLDGSLTIDDIRKEAIRARDETKDAIKDLGPDAEKALSGYLGILDHFIKETAPKPASPPAGNTTPPAKKP